MEYLSEKEEIICISEDKEFKQIVHLDEGRKASTKQLWSGKVMTFSLFEQRSHF